MSDKSLTGNFLYICMALSILLIIMLVVQAFRKDKKVKQTSGKKYAVMVKTPNGLVKSDNATIAEELENLKLQLQQNSAGAQEDCVDLTPQINRAMRNLANFIKENPSDNSDALCNIELKADLVNQYMADSITPEPYHYGTSYQSLLEWESYERDLPTHPTERLKYLIKNIDVIIKLLRFEVCDNGQIDLQLLYKILRNMNEQICKTGSMYTPTGVEITYGVDPYNKYNRPPPLPLYLKDQYSIEPFGSRSVSPKELPKKGSFGSLAKNQQVQVDGVDIFQSTDRLVPTDDFSGVTQKIIYGDKSFEGDVERDILGYKPPGHIISQLYDSSDHYTVNVNACGGKIVSDDQLWSQCVSREAPLINALNGDASQMLGCVGNCDQEPNYSNWYNKLDVAEVDTIG